MSKWVAVLVLLGSSWGISAEAAYFSLMQIPYAKSEYLLLLNTELEQVNAWDVLLDFNPKEFSIIEAKSYSPLPLLEIEKPRFSDYSHSFSFAGGMIGGVSGEVPILKIRTFGSAAPVFHVSSSTVILLHDGRGTPALITSDIAATR